MHVLEMLEGGGLLIVCVALIVFVVTQARKRRGDWPSGIISTNVVVLLIVGTGFFGIAMFIASFIA